MNDLKKDIVCFGEVLWDILPTGAVPGGAPMNVAYHLHQHNINAALITRIGNDEKGAEIKSIFSLKGVDTGFFQIDQRNETGKVFAVPDANGNMSYDIVKPVAWDFISLDEELIKVAKEAQYFIYGSLAARSEVSRQTLLTLLDHARMKVMDVNLRPPHYNREELLLLMAKSNLLKLNEDELELIGNWFTGKTGRKELVRGISQELGIKTIVVTLGAAGALYFFNDEFYEHSGYQVKVTDTVGSGDAFLAGLISRIVGDEDPATALDYACRLGAFVATKQGGCPHYLPSEVMNVSTRNV